MSTNDDKKGILNFFQQGKSQSSLHNPTLATAVLALILLGCLFGAYLMVLSRGQLRRAQDNARQLVQTVAQNGLSKYLGQEPIQNYYIYQVNGTNIGYSVISWQIHPQSESGLVLEGHELRIENVYEGPENKKSGFFYVQKNYTIANDLSEYHYEEIKPGRMGYQRVTLEYSNGVILTPKYKAVAVDNFIPFPLLDFFSALVVKNDISDGAILAVPLTNSIGIFHVKTGGQIPENVRQAYPDGTGAQTQQVVTRPPAPPGQELYYSLDNQLLWQKDILGPQTIQVIQITSKDDILNSFENAGEIIGSWQRKIAQKEESQMSNIIN
ncbi:MAG: hypothetical protein K9M57_02250 [Phycisphaerae bacterium]|nr:hypothetical protein [Phycisphaerae bacterium]